MAVVELVTEMKTSSSTDSGAAVVESTAKPLPFKDPNFVHSGIGGAAAGKKNRTWKNLKQILTTERALPWKLSDPNSLCNPDHQGTASSTVTTYWLRPCDGAEGFRGLQHRRASVIQAS
ncbi:hypothetical protein GJAV_G00020130 [Gymnothorax javanicus]|nr:hypothetical protein GJAV_G00020130 [Gymnothorax javanicus]